MLISVTNLPGPSSFAQRSWAPSDSTRLPNSNPLSSVLRSHQSCSPAWPLQTGLSPEPEFLQKKTQKNPHTLHQINSIRKVLVIQAKKTSTTNKTGSKNSIQIYKVFVYSKVAECQNTYKYFERRNYVSADNISVRCSSACEWENSPERLSHRLGTRQGEGKKTR